MVTIGETFRLGAGGHLWMVITMPDGTNGRFVMVNMTTFTVDKDATCVLHVGDHPDVHHDSVIFYADAREWWNTGPNSHDYWFDMGEVFPCQPIDLPLLKRVQDGALASPFFKKKFLGRVRACLVDVRS
jgi:hypothetical protein